MKRLLNLIALSVTAAVALSARNYYNNPVIPGDMADPTIIRVDSIYYATGTSSEWAPHYPLFKSHDLVNWVAVGHIFKEEPQWTRASFWAPELFVHNGKVYCYYSARRKSDNRSYIGVAVADSPEGEFTDYGPVVVHGSEAIDAFVLADKGNLYISWKAYGCDFRPIELMACRLTPDGLRTDGEPFSLLRDDENNGMEGQYWFRKGDYYYILYSVNGCCGPGSDYAVAVARSHNLTGPYEKYAGNPILQGDNDEIQSIGHGTVAETPDNRMFYLCHAYTAGDNFFLGRQAHLHELTIGDDGWPRFVTGAQARLAQPLPFENSIQQPVADFRDDFTGSALNPLWSWNFVYSQVTTKLKEGLLELSGTPQPGEKWGGTALCLRPAKIDYAITAGLSGAGKSFRGLTLYGDNTKYIAFGRKGNRLQVKYMADGKETVIADRPVTADTVHLRMDVEAGFPTGFSWSADGNTWTPFETELSPEIMCGLICWDRVSRPGLFHDGTPSDPALFSYCSVSYR